MNQDSNSALTKSVNLSMSPANPHLLVAASSSAWRRYAVCLVFLLASGITAPALAKTLGRAAFNIGNSYWTGTVANVNYDQNGILPYDSWTLGGEFSLLGNNLFWFGSRALFWQRPQLTGFYLGPKVIVGYYDDRQDRPFPSDLSPLLIGGGVDAGWAYRIGQRWDVGVESDLLMTDYGIWFAYRLSVGFAIR